ncbi:MAG: hypothetical protein RMJ43_12825 [Chloroherpetonaceae bacterium]|nr:hypothetical protein [Chthonomonadaceae bacterium]MDW8208713.1 hypothetical protein [Chloroherpetonaceae bacterium]
MNAAALPTLWANCVERLKDRVNNRSFWEAIEATQPITIEDSTLIIGLDALNFNLASHIQQTATMHAVNETVREVFQQPLQVRLIEGTTLADWEMLKEREAQLAASRQQSEVRPAPVDVHADSWDALYDQIARLYATTPYRSLPQGKARYANEALYTLVEAMDTLYPADADEMTERSLARILDRIAGASEIPASVLAFELERLRAWRKSEAGG